MYCINSGINVVVVAQNFNPSIFDRHWFIKNGILSEEDFLKGGMFTPSLSQVYSEAFDIMVLPDRLQFGPKVPSEEIALLTVDTVGKIVKLLPHTPFSAAGFNIIWRLQPKDEELGEISRNMFFKDGIEPFLSFDASDARFGSYMSKNIFGCRLKLDVKPMNISRITRGSETKIEILNFGFNFHKKLESDDRIEEIIAHLNRMDEAIDFAKQLMLSIQL